ncbi:choice-of-anchor D domain-containing protein [Runella sp. SP2]|uniref:choice-of-anchor D domain-containing protein n=1 Tax=Runella sp. SP2 TaxID=2268026 RepID=UPI0013DDA72E|nr:choice-of-anchor D domain-containing protein [Runella sp. SP2]
MKNLFTLTFWVSIIASLSSLAQNPDINVKYFSTNVPNNASASTTYGTSFGLIPLNNVTSTTELTIENRGTGTLTISSINITGTAASDFTVTNSPSTTLAPNATTTLRITFNPSVADRRNATVTITSNDPDESPFRINLFGTGIEPEIDVVGNGYSIANGSSTPITNNHTHFGAEFVTGGSIVRIFTIDNNDLAPLNLTGTPTKVAITGTHASDFTLTAAPSSPIARFESTTFQITFNPSGNGVRTALLTIANDDEDENPYTFAIEGVGTAPSPSADYTISTANNTITIADVNGNGETMEVSESSSNVRFFVSGRTYSIDGGPVTPFTTPANISLSNKTGIVVNTAAGNDIINVGAFTTPLPSLTINAGVGDDIVNMNGNITFAANANLDLDLQNDDGSPGRDVVNIAANANVTLTGTGNATIKVSQNVFVNAGGGLTTANGNLLVEANQQGTPTSGNFAGVRLNGLNAMFRVTGSGLLTVKGKGGNTGNDTEGIYLMSGGKILGGTNTVTLEGIGGPTSGFGSYGVLSGTSSEMSSTGGNIVINGTGDGTGVNSFGRGLGYNGVYAGGTISAGGQGNITITGRGSLNYTEEGSVGIDMRALVTTAGGNITFNGYGGGSGNSRACIGVIVVNSVAPGGMGTLTIYGEGGIGTGTSNFGVYVAHLITSNGGNISITGKEGGSSTSFGVLVGNTDLSGLNGEINTVTNGGDITVIANSVASTTDDQALIRCHPSNKVTFLPLTNGVGVNFVATNDVVGGPITISDFEFDNIIGGAIHFGDANTGTINVNEAITHAAGNVYFTTSQALNLNQSFGAGTGNIAINAAGGINPKSTTVDLSGNTISFTSGNNLNIAIGGTTVNTEYDQLNIQGAIDLRGLNLVLSGSYVPVAGNTFTIVNNDGTDAIVGTFSGLAQGAMIPNFRGSSLNATISYTGGTDNNDVVITVEAPAAPNINIKGNGLTIDNGDTSPRTEDGTDFGNVDIYSTDPVVRTFTIENTGTVDLVIPANGITKSGAGDFGIGTVLLPLTIAPGSSATFPVIIDASGNGRRTATISIQSNDPDASPYTFDVTAVGVSPEINVTGLGQDILSGDTTPSTLDDTDFGSVDVNSGVVSHTFTIQNTGGTGGDLYINTGAITIFGTHANDFSISGITLPATVSPGQSVTFVVNFNPAAIGTRTATIRIANNDLGESQYRFDVQGTGITADYTISTTGNNLVITDVTGTGETLEISQNSSNIRFDVTGKTFSLNNGLATNFPADVPLSNLASITVNTANGNDIIYVGAFTTQLPSLTINGGTGDDEVAFEGSINFASNASLDLDMQNDDANPGIDRVSFNSGNVILSGTGTATLKVSRDVFVVAGASVQTSDGNLTIESNQQTTPTAASFSGVNVTGTILVNGTGNLLLKGKGGNLTNSSQSGVVVSTGGLIQGGATGTTTIIGTGGASSGSFNRGVVVTRANSKITSSGGNVSVTGQGGGRATAAENDGILVFDGSQISAGGTGTVTVIGTGGQNSTGDSNFGVSVRGTNAQIFSNNGHVSVTGNGGGQTSGSSTSNDGIVLATTTKIMAGGSGNLSITGTGGSTSGGGNDGVVLSGELSTTGGNITILANGNATPGSTGGTHTGMTIATGGLVNAGGTGTISLTGNGGSSAGSNNWGIYMTGGAVSTSNGNIHLIANGKGTEGNNKGLDIISGTITAGGQGNLLIEGQGSLTAINSGNMGVEISGTNSTVATNNGNITITGLGGGSDEQGVNIGIYVHNSGKVNAGGSGNVILNGSGGASNGESNVGVNVGNNGVINTQGGNITITGIEGNGTFNYGINLQPGATISTASNGGNIRFNTNSFYAGEDEVSNKTISTTASGTITIQPRTSNTAINLGEITDPTTAGSSLNLNDFELDYMTTGTLIIGDVMSGNITVSQPITRPASTNVQLISGGDVIISGGSMNTNGGTLLLDPGTSPKAVKPTFNGTDVIASTLSFNSDLEITINGTTLGNGTGSTYSQLNVEGAINLTGVDLLLAGTYMPIGGEIFTIVNNDGTDAITGTFNGLAEGATMPNFRGSNLSATISYTGGTGNNDVVITVGQVCPTVSNAGPDQTPACGTTQVTLAGNTPTVGTGVWSVVSGTGGTFGNANSATSTFTGVAGNSYVLRWTISNGQCSASTDDVDVTFTQTPTVSNAGPDQTPACGTTQVTLAGNAPTVGTGVWSVVSGTGGTFGNANSATSTFTGVAGNSYVLRWTISNGQCSASTDDVDVTFTQTPTVSNAGPDQTPACGTTQVTLAGNAPTVGTGVWSVVSGTGGTFGNANSATSTFTGVAGNSYVLRWTISNGQCSASTDDVNVTFTQTPTVSNAGPDQTPACGTTQVTLAANAPTVGTGVWSVVSGTGGTFGNANSATSTFTGVAGNSYVLRWTISNGQCTASTDDVDVTFTQNLAPPTIGTITQPTCTLPTGSVVLNGLPSSGTWTLTRNPGAVTSTGTGATTTVSGLSSGTYTFTVTNAAGCTSGVSGDVDIIAPPSNVSITTAASSPICAGATSFTIPYTATTGNPTSYSITGTGITSVANGLLTSTPIVVNLSGPATGSSITYTLTVSNAGGCVSPNVTGSVAVVGPPTISLTTLQQTLNEGNSQVLCDTDANPVNGLQFGVSSSCVSGSPVWRVQVGSGAWSDWSATAPVSQPSNNQPHRYQAACDANCASTYSGVIELTINNRASVPQNVSLLVDGVTVAVGETKEVCSLVTTTLTFNANCAAGEVILYSVDGGEYSAGVPVGLVDNQFHNYRVRCRKSDGTPSCVESESGVMRLKLVTIPTAPTVSLSSTASCDATASFSGQSTCGSLRTIWYNATTNVALPSLPATVPSQTTSYYARCQTENGCVSEKSNVVTFTLTPTQVAPVITASQEIVCTGTTVTVSANCPAGSQTFWNTGVTAPSFEVAFSNVTKQTYWAKCVFEGGCQSAESMKKDVYWNAFVVTLINIGESKSAVKPANDKSLWTSQFITRDGGPELEQSTQVNPTLYYVENANKLAPRYWTVNVEACGLSTDGSLTFDMLATPEMGVIRSFNTHENNAPYFMYANREGWTELYAQNHPAYGFYQDNGVGGNVYDTGLPKGLYKLSIRYWDQKGWGSIYPSTRKPQGNVLAYQEYWFRIQSRDGVGVGAARTAESEVVNGKEQGSDNGKQLTDNGVFATVLPNPVTNILRLKVQDSKGQTVQAALTDASGREVLRRQFVPETNTHQEEFGVRELPTGMYFLKVTTADQQATLKVVKVE